MVTTEEFRTMALSFPGSEEQDHRGHPSFRVNERIFATLWPDERRAVLKLAIAEQSALVRTAPEIFSLNAWSKQGWTNVSLLQISRSECRRLLEEAWRGIAPKKLARGFDEARVA